MMAGYATAEGTGRFSRRFPDAVGTAFFRSAHGLTVSSLGIGSYLGEMDAATDDGYRRSMLAALSGGINFIDTSLNYRHQLSERAIGAAIGEWTGSAAGARDEIVVATKAGYLVPDAVPFNVLRREDVVAGMHSLAPAFLADQLRRSRENLGLQTIDIFYLHNPETQLGHVGEDVFYDRMRAAFEECERAVAAGDVRSYGTATWDGYRKGALSLRRLDSVARSVAGDRHHFRFVQLPVNLAMTEALSPRANADGNIPDIAQELGITVVASASLLQARLARDLPEQLAGVLQGLDTDAQRAIQFTRSAPGVTVALVGMSDPEHVRENLGVARTRPATAADFRRLFA